MSSSISATFALRIIATSRLRFSSGMIEPGGLLTVGINTTAFTRFRLRTTSSASGDGPVRGCVGINVRSSNQK